MLSGSCPDSILLDADELMFYQYVEHSVRIRVQAAGENERKQDTAHRVCLNRNLDLVVCRGLSPRKARVAGTMSTYGEGRSGVSQLRGRRRS